MSSTQVIDVKVKKPRAPKKDKNEPSDSIPPPSVDTTTVTSATEKSSETTAETKTKKPRATKKDKTSAETPVETASTSPTATATDVESDAKQKKPRAPTLPAKFAKFIKFNFFFINQLTDIDQETKDAYLNTFAVFAPVEQQTQIVTDFLLTQKSVNKDYRSAISAQKKAAAKANKPQRRSKKSVQVDFQNNLVNQLIESANQPSETNDTNDKKDKEKKPRGRKPKQTESVTNTEAAKDTKDTKDTKDAKEKKPRGRKPKQTESETTTTEATKPSTDASNDASASTEDDDEDTEVSRFVHGGKTFLRDQNNNLYDELSHEPVGENDPATDSVINL
jgi:hypothetical protein